MAPAEVLAVHSRVMETLMRDFEIQLGQQERCRERVVGVGERGDGEMAGAGIGLNEMCNKLQRALCSVVL